MEYEAEIVEGIEDLAEREILDRFPGVRVTLRRTALRQFSVDATPPRLSSLRLVSAVYIRLTFAIPRPKALLGHQHLTRLLTAIHAITSGQRDRFTTLSIDAAGSESSVMQRIKQELASALDLSIDPDKGDLHLRMRRSLSADGWDVLIRTTPRPLVTRAWRVCNYEGALNATVAAAMITLLQPAPDESLLNLMCGSGSLLIERLVSQPGAPVVGCDISPEALACAANNLHAFGAVSSALIISDVTRLPFPDAGFPLLVADLPFGQLIGSHDSNRSLYPAVLSEAFRVTRPSGRFAVITHEVKLMEQALRGTGWQVDSPRMITLRGLHPRIYVLRKP
jgi:23S rRNA G2445 N2-methylase RlmL